MTPDRNPTLRSVHLRKVVERLCLVTGEVHKIIDMSDGAEGPSKIAIEPNVTYMHGTPKMFTSNFVDNILNHYSREFVFTLTEEEYHHVPA